MIKVKLTHVGSSLGIELPREVFDKLIVGRGDILYLVEGPHSYTLTASDPACLPYQFPGNKYPYEIFIQELKQQFWMSCQACLWPSPDTACRCACTS